MSHDLNLVRTFARKVVTHGLLPAALACFAFTANGAQDPPAGNDTYTWSAELIAFDAARDMATFRSMFASHASVSDSAQLEAGEEMYLTWSGLRFANAVRALNRDADAAPASLTLPIRFERLDGDGRYVEFSLEIPQALTETLRNLQPGYWVTATSPRFPFDTQEAVVAIRPYNDVE